MAANRLWDTQEIITDAHLHDQFTEKYNISHCSQLTNGIEIINLYFIFHSFYKPEMQGTIGLLILRITIFFG